MNPRGVGLISLTHTKSTQSIIYRCPLNHPGDVTKVCLESNCTKPRLACAQCFQLVDHFKHKNIDLNQYRSYLGSTQKIKTQFQKEQKILKDQKNQNLTKLAELKSKTIQCLENIEYTYKNVWEAKFNEMNASFGRKIGQSQSLVNPTVDLEKCFQQIHKSNREIQEMNHFIGEIQGSIENYMRQSYDDLEGYIKNLKTPFGKIEKANLKHNKAPQTNNFFFLNIQKTPNSIHSNSKTKRKHQQNQPMLKQKPEKTNTSQSKLAIINTIIPSVISNSGNFTWSSQFKGEYIELNGSTATKNYPNNAGKGPSACSSKSIVLSNETLNLKQRSFWKIALQNGYDWIITGICLKNVVENNKYGFHPKTAEHGCFAFGTNGKIYCYKQQQHNDQDIGHQIHDNNMVLSMMFNPQKSIISFKKIVNGNEENLCFLEVSKNIEYNIFVFISKHGDTVDLS